MQGTLESLEPTRDLTPALKVAGDFFQIFAVYCDGTVTLTWFEKMLSMFSELTEVTT
jgi:hypothetical protein